ncbi:MAG TPA: YceI family protein [Phycisphaerae bacterium]|nr:YceI family protein [Phycisphaerae bacterium]
MVRPLTFKSTAAKKIDDTTLEVTGDLTIHGVTKSITVKIAMTGTGKDMKGNPVIGFESTFTVNRNDFGIKEFPGVLGDDVTFTISLEGDKK